MIPPVSSDNDSKDNDLSSNTQEDPSVQKDGENKSCKEGEEEDINRSSSSSIRQKLKQLLRHEDHAQEEDGSRIPNSMVQEGIAVPKKNKEDDEKRKYLDEFTTWCRKKLGIQTNLEIQFFEYKEGQRDREMIRGLAASRNITSGEVIASVPFQSMITTSTIFHDPVLSTIFSSTKLSTNNNDDNDNDDDSNYTELVQLIIYILYQQSLGRASPIKHYMDVLRSAPVHTIPFLWSKEKLHQVYPDADNGVRTASEAIMEDLEQMYDDVIPKLKQNFPEFFSSSTIYSLENFKWAYAIVNSRHWHLPCEDLDNHLEQPQPSSQYDSPPLNEKQHAILVPWADLINFGPPCAKGRYNPTNHSFEIVATCNFLPGEQVTFWYTDDCEDLVMANFGFTNELIAPCPRTLEEEKQEWRDQAVFWKEQSTFLQKQLVDVQKQMQDMQKRMEEMKQNCKCEPMFVSPTTTTSAAPPLVREKVDGRSSSGGSSAIPSFPPHKLRGERTTDNVRKAPPINDGL